MSNEERIQKIFLDNKKDEDFKLFETFEKYKYYWRWILFSILSTLVLAFIYLRYSTKQFNVKTAIFINNSEHGSINTTQDAFNDLAAFRNGTQGSVLNEVSILKSYSLMENVVKELKLNISYYLKGRVRNVEIYGLDIPYNVNFISNDSILFELDTLISITPKSKIEYFLSNENNKVVREAKFGENVNTVFGAINISISKDENIKIGETTLIKILPLKEVVLDYNERTKVNAESDESSIINISLIDGVREKAIDILNVMVTIYMNQYIEYRKHVSEKTDEFINDRIRDVYEDLATVDVSVEEFKIKNKLTDMGTESGIDISTSAQIQARATDLNAQLNLVRYVQEYLRNNKESLIPANIGISEASINENVNNYNRLLLERERILRNSSQLNPVIVDLESQIVSIRKNIEQSLNNFESSLTFSLNGVRNQEYSVNSKRVAAPKQEREFQDFRRRQQIVESLYLYLLQKREENVITLGMPLPNAKLIDKAHGDEKPVFPKPLIIYLISGLVGFMLPVSIISLKSLFDNKVHSYKDVQYIVKAPFLGEIPRTRSKGKIVISSEDNSSIAESFRLLRTNVEFMLSNVSEGARTVFVTSTLSSEGKTFIAINLAASLAILNKKVLLVGTDIRKPKIGPYLGLNSDKGLTEFLSDKNLLLDDIIVKEENYGFDVIDSGEIPPNPSELLLNGRFINVINFGKKNYDYVIIDTSPVNMVTDTLLLGHFADLFIYIVRAEVLDKRQLEVPKMMYENNRLPNMTLLINSINTEKSGYGYGYGYSYNNNYNNSKNKKSWWKKFKI